MNNHLLLFSLLAYIPAIANNATTVERGVQHHAQTLTHFPILETERLLIRDMTLADIDDIFALTSDPEIIRLTPIFELSKTKEDAAGYIEARMQNYAKGQPDYRAIVLKTTNKAIGIITIDIASRYRADIGYAVAREYWSQGLATEAAEAIINFGFHILGLKRIEAVCDPRNSASARVLEKCGMSYEGLMKAYSYTRGEFCDRKLYATINQNV